MACPRPRAIDNAPRRVATWIAAIADEADAGTRARTRLAQPPARERHGHRALVVATPLAWWLAFTRRARTIVEAVVALPLVLPPTVLGFYLLVLLGPAGALGGLGRAHGHAR